MVGFAIPHSTGCRQILQDCISACNEVGSHAAKSFAFSGILLGSLLLHLTALRYQSVILTSLLQFFPLYFSVNEFYSGAAAGKNIDLK